jgi:hypothetical protein
MSDGVKKALGIGGVVIVGGLAVWLVYGSIKGEDIPSNTRMVMCSETGELFPEELRPGLGPYPHKNPKTGEKTLYPIEWCYNGPCEEKGGTPVILNESLGKKDPTRCPVCGDIVRFHNPRPAPSSDR